MTPFQRFQGEQRYNHQHTASQSSLSQSATLTFKKTARSTKKDTDQSFDKNNFYCNKLLQ